MKIGILGVGYVGLVTGTCFAEMGNTVTCYDTDYDKIRKLNTGTIPIYERGLGDLIDHNVEDSRLFFTEDLAETVKGADVVFICVGTPPGVDGSANLQYVFDAAKQIARHITGYTVVVTKSTVPVGTSANVKEILTGEVAAHNPDARFDVVNNPEFLKEGNAITDFMRPDRVVVGVDSDRATDIMHRLYSPFLRTDDRMIFMSVPSSELTKYASNAMLASRISFMNEVALLAEKVGADVEQVRMGMSRDQRIGKYFLYAGAGYGGSCFPKDISALIHLGRVNGQEMKVVRAVEEANRAQKLVMAEKILRFFDGKLNGRKIAMWGLAFKPETDDVRESPAHDVARSLRGAGAVLAVHDPEAIENSRETLGDEGITYCEQNYDALDDADALVVMTEWKEYRAPDWQQVIDRMRQPVVFDGRNLFDPDMLREQGVRYFGVGHGERI